MIFTELPPALEAVDLARIDGSDETLAITPGWFPMDRLAASVRDVGVVTPLHLQPTAAGDLRIAMGFRRYRAARAAALGAVPALVWSRASDLQLFQWALAEKAAGPLHDLERARALVKLREHFEVREEALIERYLPLLRTSASRYRLRFFLRLGRLDEALQHAVHRGLDPETALRLAAWTAAERQRFLDLLERYEPGRNRQRELFDLLDDLRSGERPRGSGALDRVWDASGAREVDEDARTDRPLRFRRILECLHRLRRPHLSRHQDRYRRLKGELKVPPQIRLQVPPYFEGDLLSVSFSCRNPAEFRHLAGRIEEMAGRPELGRIFELL